MALSHFHYFVTCFVLTIWSNYPTLVMVMAWGLQVILYACGVYPGDLSQYFCWQFLTVLASVGLGVGFYMVTRAPPLLKLQAAYADSWIRFSIFMAVFILAQLFYGFWPVPDSPGGLIGTMLIHLGLVLGMWWWYSLSSTDAIVPTSVNNFVFKDYLGQDYLGRNYMFAIWALVLFTMEAMFFLTYAIGSDHLTVYAATALGAFMLIGFAAVYPLNPAYKKLDPAVEPMLAPRAADWSQPPILTSEQEQSENKSEV